MLHNPYIPEKQKQKILSYEPWHPEDRKLPINKRREHPENIKNGTADEYMWLVYGQGKRGALKGLIHKNVQYIDNFPELDYWYGLDFGFTTDPTALVKTTIKGKNIYFELLCYEPTETPETLDNFMETVSIERFKPIIADSSDKYSNDKGTVEMVRDLKMKQWRISKVSKTKTINYWITKLNEYNIHIVKNHLVNHAKIEAENYKWREINGIQINQPIDAYDHFWNAARYAFMEYFRQGLKPNKNWF